MEKLPMCRICLVENVRMYVVVNKSLHELYEKLTNVPFVTRDSRPILACFFCCTKLKQCYRLLRKCLQAEEMFAQMMNEDYEPNPLLIEDHLEFFCGFVSTPVVHLSISDERQLESVPVKEELPDIHERLYDELKKKPEINALGSVNLVSNYAAYVKNLPPDQTESDSEDDVPLMEFKIEVQDEHETIGSTVTKTPKLGKRRRQQDNKITVKRTKYEHSTTIGRSKNQDGVNNRIYNTNNTNKDDLNLKKPHKCDVCQKRFMQSCHLKRHYRMHTGENLYKCKVCKRSFYDKSHLTKHFRSHTGEKPFKCDICQSSFSDKDALTIHIRLHTGEKPFKCDICQRDFIRKCQLNAHILLHTGEKPYICDICQCSFREKGVLTKHIRIHTGENPFKCHVCQRDFSRKCDLTAHIIVHRKEKILKSVK